MPLDHATKLRLRSAIKACLARQEREPGTRRILTTAWTAEQIAREIGVSTHVVQKQLDILVQITGQVTTRRPRSGEVLYKLPDRHHRRWLDMRSRFALGTAR
jgi:hypothetical protein